MYFSNRYQNKSWHTNAIIDYFSSVFNRDITVQEYVKYYDIFCNNIEVNINSYLENFKKKFGIVSNIFIAYLDKATNHTEFIHLYLDYIDMEENEFMDKIIEITIKYDTYEEVMKNKVVSIYKSSFSEDITTIDVKFFFEEIRKEKLSLVDECLPKNVTSLKEQTDTYENIMKSKFNIILQRDPDRSEMDFYIEYFRKPVSGLRPEITLENELYESLEYHDIVKQIIISIIQDRTKLIPNKSIVFKHLSNILNSTDANMKRNIESIKDYLIQSCL